jgi:hypothetical protein
VTEDAIDEFLRQKKPDNAIVVKANWRDNPWFRQFLRRNGSSISSSIQSATLWRGAGRPTDAGVEGARVTA